jgi:phenylacetate-CoA ligase
MIHPKEVIEAYKLLKNQWKSPEEIKRIQSEKLRKMVKHAYEKVPYYRQLFDSIKLKSDDVRSIEDLKKLPIIYRKTVQNIPFEQKMAVDTNIKKCKSGMTSGTTAVPLRVYWNNRDSRMLGFAMVRSFLACGVKPWYRIAEFVGSADVPPKRRIFDRYCIWRNLQLSAFEEPEKWITKLQKWNPNVLLGYILSLKLLAETILEKNIRGINPQIIISHTAVLDEKSREFLRSVFKAKIFDYYGAWESGFISWECPQCTGFHINSDMVILELIKDGEPVPAGQEGEVVITNLVSSTMPFLRYHLGDVAVLSEEKPVCGRPFPLLKKILGRVSDFIILPSGKRLTAHPFHMLMCDIQDIVQYRIIQEKVDLLSVEIVPAGDFHQALSNTVKKELWKIVGQSIKINVSLVKEIKIPPMQKRRWVYSKISETG